MRPFGHFLLSSRLHTIGLVSLTAVISFYLSSVLIALAVMRRGGKFGIQVIAGCILLLVLAVSLLQRVAVTDVLMNALLAWVPVWCCAMVLRQTESQAAMTMVAGAFGALFVIMIYVLVDDVPVWWQSWFNEMLNMVIDRNMTGDDAGNVERFRAFLTQMAPWINTLIISFLVIRLITVILIGRWWQAQLFNPGGFRQEFYALLLPRFLVYLAVLGVAALLLGDVPELMPVRDLLWLLVIMYLFQGLASVHRLVRGRELSPAWLVAMYSFLLILFPNMIVFLACIGMADSWVRSKKRRVDSDTNPQ
ncbi:MAG: hypothetical protein HW386_742 [Gammaproteobacteria bacterium]|nr:hypothetical protein [Gammaproteobacteria bacterium]